MSWVTLDYFTFELQIKITCTLKFKFGYWKYVEMNMWTSKLFSFIRQRHFECFFFRFDKPPLIVVSLDGFRADYIKRNLTPVLDKIGRCGVRTDRMRSVFPTKTFPNHFSIVTVSGKINCLLYGLSFYYVLQIVS